MSSAGPSSAGGGGKAGGAGGAGEGSRKGSNTDTTNHGGGAAPANPTDNGAATDHGKGEGDAVRLGRREFGDIERRLSTCVLQFLRPSQQALWPTGAILDSCSRTILSTAHLVVSGGAVGMPATAAAAAAAAGGGGGARGGASFPWNTTEMVGNTTTGNATTGNITETAAHPHDSNHTITSLPEQQAPVARAAPSTATPTSAFEHRPLQQLVRRYPWLGSTGRVVVVVTARDGRDGDAEGDEEEEEWEEGEEEGDGGHGGGVGKDDGSPNARRRRRRRRRATVPGGAGRAGGAGRVEEDASGTDLVRRWHGLYPETATTFKDKLLPDLPDYCGLDDGDLTEEQVEGLAAFHEVSFIEQKSREVPIPGLGGILKVLMKVTMPSIMDPWLDRLSEHTTHTLSDQMEHKLVSELPKLTVKLVEPPLSFNVTSLCTDAVTASLTKALVTSLSMELGPRIALPVQDAINSKIYETVAPFLQRSVPDKVAKIIPMLLQRSLPMYITSRVTKALTHSLIPTLTHALSHTPQQDIWCHYCYYYHHYCNYCHDSAESQYYTIYYSDYYSDYYGNYYAKYYVDALSEIEKKQHPQKKQEDARQQNMGEPVEGDTADRGTDVDRRFVTPDGGVLEDGGLDPGGGGTIDAKKGVADKQGETTLYEHGQLLFMQVAEDHPWYRRSRHGA